LTEDEQKFLLKRTSMSNLSQYTLSLLALVRLLAGDEKGYQEACARIVRDADRFVEPLWANALSRSLSASAAETIDRAVALRLAERSVAADPKVAWYWYGLGAAQYRAGKHDEAIRSLKESLNVNPTWLGRGQNYVFLAMACQKLGRHDEAR